MTHIRPFPPMSSSAGELQKPIAGGWPFRQWRGGLEVMELTEKLGLVLALAMIAGLAMALAGCLESGGPGGSGFEGGNPTSDQRSYYNNGSGRNFPQEDLRGNGSFGNLTQEQRQQLFSQRMRQAAAACAGKAEGGACEIASSRGSRQGTCNAVQGNLTCVIPRPSGQLPGQ